MLRAKDPETGMSVINIAASGMAAAMARLNVSAQNVANSQSNGALPDFQAANGTTAAVPTAYAPLQLSQFSLPLSQGGGVQTQVSTSPNLQQTAYDPSASYADARGLVATPNVDPAIEAVNQIEALNQFKASVNLFKVGEEMMAAALKLTV
jgi:flagellar basal-body rod protein FlgC